jgi:hypothetical protein
LRKILLRARSLLAVFAAVAGAALMVGLTAVAVRAADRLLSERMAELKAQTVQALETLTGRHITYGSISPSFFRTLEVRDLLVLDEQNPGQPLLVVRQLKISYSILRLISRRDPVGAIREVQILNTGISVDLERDKDVVDLLQRITRAGGAVGSPLAARITGANISLQVTAGETSLGMDNLFFEIGAKPDAISVSFRGMASGALPDGLRFRSNVRAAGTFDPELTSTDMTVRLLSFQSSVLDAGAQTLQVVWKGPSLVVRKIQDRSPVALELQADLDKGDYTFTFQSEQMRMDRLVSLSGSLSRFGNWLRAPVTSSGHVTWHASTRSLEYRVDASAFFADQLPVRDVTLDTSFRGTERVVFFEPLRMSSTAGTIDFEGSVPFPDLLPTGVLTVSNLRSGSSEAVNASLTLERIPGGLHAQSTRFAIGSVGFDDLRFSLVPLTDGVAFSAVASFEGGPGQDSLSADGTVRFGAPLARTASEGDLRNLGAPRISVNMGLKNLPPDRIYHLLEGAGDLTREQQDLATLLATFSVSADVTLETDLSSISVQSSSVTVTRPQEPGTVITFGLAADSSRISVTDFAGTWKGLSFKGGFEGKLAAGGQVAFATSLEYLGSSYSFTGSYAPELGLSATGSYGLSIAAQPQHNGATQVRLAGDHFPLPVRGAPVLVSFDLSGLVTTEGEWSLDIPSVTLYDIPFLQSKKNTIEASGKLTPTRLDLTRLVVTDAFSTLSGGGGADLTLPSDPLAGGFLRDVTARGSAVLSGSGGESYSLTGGLAAGSLSADFRFAAAPLPRLGKTAFTGTLSGTGSVNGPLDAPRISVTAELKDGKLGTDPLFLAARVDYGDGSLAIRSATVGYLSHRLTNGTGTLNVRTGSLAFTGSYQGEYFSDDVRMTVGLDGSFSAGAWPDVFSDGVKTTLNLTGITVAGTPFPAWSLNVRSQAGRLAFDGGPGASVKGWIDPSLAFSLSLAEPLPLIGTATGSLVGDRITASAKFETIELTILNPMLKSGSVLTPAGTLPIYHVTSGVATGTVTVNGPVNDPDFSGSLDIVGGGLESAYAADEVGPVRGTLVFNGKTFGAAKTIAATGPARVSAVASFTLDHWVPRSFDILIATEGTTPARLRGRWGRLIAEGSGTGEMHIVGDDRQVAVTGNVVVSDCRITLGDMPPGKFVPEDVPTIVSVTAETGRRVEFFWPSADLPVLRTTATPGGKVAVTYRGDTGAYTVKGSTSIQGGEIYYFDRSFIMKKGTITFDEDQADFDPWIAATAEVREWDPETAEEVRITLNADSPFSKFSPRFTSDPPRTDAVILAMIGAPLVTRAETQGLGLAALVYTDILSQNWILRPFEQKVRQLLNLDMFSVRTQILQNLLAQKLFGSTDNPLDNTTVSLGKYLGNDLFLEMLVRLQQPEVTSLPGAGLISVPGLTPDLELTLEWSTPFFLLDWSFLPRHPESLFLVDNSLSFTWRFSY